MSIRLNIPQRAAVRLSLFVVGVGVSKTLEPARVGTVIDGEHGVKDGEYGLQSRLLLTVCKPQALPWLTT